MKHADRFAERILFLDGLPNFQALGKLRIGETPDGDPALPIWRWKWTAWSGAEGRHRCTAGRERFRQPPAVRDILDSEEEHIDWLETQLSLVERIRRARTCAAIDAD